VRSGLPRRRAAASRWARPHRSARRWCAAHRLWRGGCGFQDPVGDRRDAQPLVVQAARVQGPPLGVGAVGALDPVPDRDVYVQLGVAVAGQVVQEQTGGQTAAVAPLPRAGRVMAGASVGGVLFQPGDGFAGGVHQRGLDLVRAGVQGCGVVVVAAVAGLAGGDPVGGMQHGHALDRTDGQVKVRDAMRVLAPRGRADLGQLGRAGVRVRGQVGRDRGGLAVPGLLGLPPLDQELAAGTDVLLVQLFNDVRVDPPAEPERRGALPGPFPGWFSGRGVVGHGSGAAAAVLPAGEVGDVMALMQRDVSRHDPPLPVPVPRSSFVMPVSGAFRSRREGKRRLRTFCGFPGRCRPAAIGGLCEGLGRLGYRSVTHPESHAPGRTGLGRDAGHDAVLQRLRRTGLISATFVRFGSAGLPRATRSATSSSALACSR